MESREYGISTPGSDGEYGGQVRKEQYSDDRMDGQHGPEPYAVRLQWYRFPSVRSDIRIIC